MRARTLALVVASGVLAVSGCVPLPGSEATTAPALPAASAAPVPSEGSAPGDALPGVDGLPPVVAHPSDTPQDQALEAACAAFGASHVALLEVIGVDVVPQPSGEVFAAAMQDFSYAVGSQSIAAGDTGDVPMMGLLQGAGHAAGRVADEMYATGGSTASTWLVFRTSLEAVAEPCGIPVEFVDG